MARDFDGSADFGLSTTTPVTAAPVTLACWFNPDSIATATGLFGIFDSGSARNWHTLGITSSTVIMQTGIAAGTGTATATATGSNGTWHHGCGVVAAANSRAVYIDGANKGTNAASGTPSGIDRIAVGVLGDSSPSAFFNGQIAECAIWNIALSDAEVALLADGVSPLMVRPDALVFYSPMIGRYSPEIDVVGGHSLTLTSAPPVADHPRVFYVPRLSVGVPVGAEPPSGRIMSSLAAAGGLVGPGGIAGPGGGLAGA